MCVCKASKVIESFVVMEPNVGYKRTREMHGLRGRQLAR